MGSNDANLRRRKHHKRSIGDSSCTSANLDERRHHLYQQPNQMRALGCPSICPYLGGNSITNRVLQSVDQPRCSEGSNRTSTYLWYVVLLDSGTILMSPTSRLNGYGDARRKVCKCPRGTYSGSVGLPDAEI